MNNRLINTKVAGGGGCTDIVDNYDPFGDSSGVALYQLNGNANDVSGNYNGTATNITYGTGVFGQAGVFNGSSSKIVSSSSITGNLARTISVWYKTTSTDNILVSLGTSSAVNNSQFSLAPKTNSLSVYGYVGSGANVDEEMTGFSTNLISGNWTHLVVSWDGLNPGTLRAYVNGALESTLTRSSGEAYNTSAGLQLGTWVFGNRWLNGSLDQVRIFNTVLTPLEVEALYTEELCICDGTVDTLDILGDGSCIATYQLDGDASDLSGNYSGTPTNVSYGVGEFDLAGVFNGSSSSINTNFAQNTSNAFSWSFWFNGNSTQGAIPLIIDTTSSTSPYPGVGVGYEGATVYTFISGGTVTPGAAVSPNTWAHVVLTHDGSGNFSFYVNNSPVFTNISRTSNLYSGQKILLGDTTVWNKFNGSIDQVRIFNKALNQAEVTTLYNETACTVPNPLENVDFHYDPTTLSDGAVTAWSDGGNINRDLELVSGTTTISKVTSGGIEYVDFPFSGSDTTPSVLRVGGSPLTTFSDYPTNTSVTFVQFVNISTSYHGTIRYPEPMGIYNTDGSENGALQYILWRYGLSVQYRAIVIANNGSRFYNVGSASEATYIYPYGTWRMISFTFEYNPSATSYLKIYIDGALKETWTNTGTWGVANNTLILGHKDTAFYEARGGYKIGDTLGFFGEAKTQSEMAAIYTSLKGKYGL